MRILNDSTELVPVENLTRHPDNPRRGDREAIRESIAANGFYGTLIVQRSTGHVLAGNHRYEAAVAEGATHLPVTYVDVTDEEAKRILVADNRTSDLAENDEAALSAILAELMTTEAGLAGTGYGDDDLAELLADEPNPYTNRVTSPIYTPKRPEPPPVTDLYDRTRTEALLAEISQADLDPELADFLRAAAERHTAIRFDLAAEFYAHATPEVQRLMEASALVIIDYEQAIERGFVKLNETTLALFNEELTERQLVDRDS